MAFLRKQTSEGSIGLLYSVIQKCMRRGMEEECLYYSGVLFNEGTPNSLRKRLVYITNEDIGHINLSLEIMNCSDDDLFKYVANNQNEMNGQQWRNPTCSQIAEDIRDDARLEPVPLFKHNICYPNQIIPTRK